MASFDLRGLGCTNNPTVSHGYSQSQCPMCNDASSDIMRKVALGSFAIVAIVLLVLVMTAFICGLRTPRVLVSHSRGLEWRQAWEEACGLIILVCNACNSHRLMREMKRKKRPRTDIGCEKAQLGVMVLNKGLDGLSGVYIR